MIDAPKPSVMPTDTDRVLHRGQGEAQPDFDAWLDHKTPTPPAQPAHRNEVLAPPSLLEAEVGALGAVAELSAVSQTGEVITRTLPWQLVANGLLSQLWQSVQTQILSPSTVQPGASDTTATIGAPFRAENANPIAMKAGTEQAHSLSTPYPITSHLTQVTTNAERGLEERSAVASAERHVWPARLSRLLGHPDSAVEYLLVRDYLSEESEVRQAVDELRAFMGEQGRNLDRIALNGHVIWTRKDGWMKGVSHGN